MFVNNPNYLNVGMRLAERYERELGGEFTIKKEYFAKPSAYHGCFDSLIMFSIIEKKSNEVFIFLDSSKIHPKKVKWHLHVSY